MLKFLEKLHLNVGSIDIHVIAQYGKGVKIMHDKTKLSLVYLKLHWFTLRNYLVRIISFIH